MSEGESITENLTLVDLKNKTLKEIYGYAREFKIPYYSQMNKKELSLAVIRAQAEKQGFYYMSGVLDITSQQDGYGFLRPINYGSSQEDIYISSSQIRRFGLRNGDLVAGKARPPKPKERYYGLMHVDSVNGKHPEEAKQRPHFPALTPLYPNRQMILETARGQIATRIIDLFAPIGFGQRGLIVAPPKAGKTSLLKRLPMELPETTRKPSCCCSWLTNAQKKLLIWNAQLMVKLFIQRLIKNRKIMLESLNWFLSEQ